MQETSGPGAGQSLTLKTFDSAGRRVSLAGAVVEAAAGTAVVELELGDAALELAEGTKVLVEFEDEAGRGRFSSTVLGARLAGGLRVKLEVPEQVPRQKARGFTRHCVQAPVRATRLERDGSGREHYELQTEEISAKGASLVCACKIEVGARLSLELELPSAGLCLLGAEVRHCRPAPGSDRADYRWGVEFLQSDERNLARLQSFLKARRR